MEAKYVYPYYQITSNRICSFPYTKRHLIHAYRNFANAGFFYIGQRFALLTFCCGKNYSSGDYFIDPWEVHSALEPNCPFVQEYILKTRQTEPDESI